MIVVSIATCLVTYSIIIPVLFSDGMFFSMTNSPPPYNSDFDELHAFSPSSLSISFVARYPLSYYPLCVPLIPSPTSTNNFWFRIRQAQSSPSSPLSALLMKWNVTLVSAFFNIGESKHPLSEYEEWMRNFFNVVMHTPMILFVDTVSALWIADSVAQFHNTLRTTNSNSSLLMPSRRVILVYTDTVWNVPFMSFRHSNYGTDQLKVDPEYPKIKHSAGLYAIWNCKPWFLSFGSIYNPFQSSVIVWTDMGSFRHGDLYQPIHAWQDSLWPNAPFLTQLLSETFPDRVLVVQVNQQQKHTLVPAVKTLRDSGTTSIQIDDNIFSYQTPFCGDYLQQRQYQAWSCFQERTTTEEGEMLQHTHRFSPASDECGSPLFKATGQRSDVLLRECELWRREWPLRTKISSNKSDTSTGSLLYPLTNFPPFITNAPNLFHTGDTFQGGFFSRITSGTVMVFPCIHQRA